MTTAIRILVCSLCALLLGVTACARTRHLYTFTDSRLGTTVTFRIVARNQEQAASDANSVFGALAAIEADLGPDAKGDLYRINADAARQPVAVGDQTLALVMQVLEISRETAGAFDISAAHLAALWDFNAVTFNPPAPYLVKNALDAVDYNSIQPLPAEKSVRLLKPRIRLSSAGFLRGYALQTAADVLRKGGTSSFCIEAGGVCVAGGSLFRDPWRAGIRHPREKKMLVLVHCADGDALATAGDYGLFVLHQGERYHQVLDPRSGHPVKTLASVTVVAKNALHAEAYASALMVMGRERAIGFLGKKPEIAAVLIDRDMSISASASLQNKILPLEKKPVAWF